MSHAVAALGIVGLPWPLVLRGCALALLLAHAYWRRPRAPELVVLNRNGLWALPQSGLSALSLGAATRHASWWADLELIGPRGTRRLLLCRDQLPAAQWRDLQLALGRPGPARDLS